MSTPWIQTALAQTPLVPERAETSFVSPLAPYASVFVVALLVSIIATPLMRKLAATHGVVDWPDLKRKNHARPVAYLGGVAILLGWIAGIMVSYTVNPQWVSSGSPTLQLESFPLSILIGAGVITCIGLYDDVYGTTARVKIGGQLFATAALTWDRIGINLTEQLFGLVGLAPPDSVIYMSATLLVALFVLGGCNAVNLIDGLDGLASGVVVIAMVGFLAIALLVNFYPNDPQAILDNPKRIILCLAAIGAILGFLPYNFNPASIFMGDAGSLLLGFLSVSAILLFGDAGGYSLKLVTAALIVFAVPITDTSLAIVRRKLRGQPIFSPDNQHLHHLLRKTGLTVKQSVSVMYAAAIVFGLIGVGTVAFQLQWRYSLAIVFVIYGLIMVAAFRYGAYCIALERLAKTPISDASPPLPVRPSTPKAAPPDDPPLASPARQQP
ncbi:MAG: MraY family glycosyltransferase [Planctomycetota bacterium]